MKLDKFTVRQLAEIDSCTRCGNCLDLCTAYMGSGDVSISPKKKMEKLKKLVESQYGILSRLINRGKVSKKDIDALSRAAFACTMCSRCEINCHISINLQDIWLKLREILIENGTYPEVLGLVKERLKKGKNVSFDINEGRANWVSQIEGAPENKYIKEKAEVIYFVGCVSSFSPRVFKIPRSVVQIFNLAKVDFGLLGDEEWCCGFPLLASGFKKDFMDFAEHNIERVNSTGAKYLVTSCPSCYHMWTHTYKSLDLKAKMNFKVIHLVQYLYELALKKELELYPVDATVTYHDPCDLGRNSGIYEEPRALIKLIPGIKFVELPNSRKNSLCCGGGGNLEAVDKQLSEEIAALKAKDIIETKADIIVTACQQCVRTISGGLKKENSKIKTMDISELVLMSVTGAK
jgi:heterodisulfide reductase subunit D